MKTVDILIYSGKHGNQYWLVDTPARLEAAQRVLFQQLDEMDCYEDEALGCPSGRLDAARNGIIGAIRRILEDRNGCEYEEWEIKAIEVPEPVCLLPSLPGHPSLLSFNIYQQAAYATADYSPNTFLFYPALGLAGEAGEVANKVKKIERDDNGILTPKRRAQIEKELGDVLWYVAALATDIGASLTEIAAKNLENLYDRKNRGMIHGNGDNR